ncbi:LysR family transcriptional regulator [Pseudomonas protegens]|jgi:DNA-binding transcriptional LysR family regulator|uniref:LysR family transcriptional regulator n=1 Tax=Pseudomonas protegens TaxID=380021 RepID=UPI00098D6163|nr:LysR family transcriptional regulator [Pseudomonas protegens]AQT11522.1 LysR family transcriptional regulator [Pseudomonas protegens]GED74927.1 transcriptional regulator [Pseudomonas fluorescens]
MKTDIPGDKNSQLSRRRLPPLSALRCFEAAARLESFTQAGATLHLTHGAISRAVRALEEDLGTPLFERRSQRVFLTAAGAELLHSVTQALDLIESTASRLRAPAPAAPLVLSCEPTLLMRWLIPRMPGFYAEYPQVPIQLLAGGGPFSFGAGIDLAIRRNDFAWSRDTQAHWLFDEAIGPVCRPERQADWTPATAGLAQLAAQAPRLHSATRPHAWQQWLQLQQQPVAPTPPEQVFEHFYFSLQAAVAGLGLAIAPWQLVRDDLEGGLLCAPFGFVADGSAYYLLSPQAIDPDSASGKLLHWLRRQALA